MTKYDPDYAAAYRARHRDAKNATADKPAKKSTKKSSTKVEVPDVESINLPPKSLDFFRALAEDAGNWSGTPWLTGNVSYGRSTSALSQALVRRGLITVGHGGDGDDAYAIFTPLGVAFAQTIGVDLSYVS